VETSDSTKTASSAVTLENPIPQIATASPMSIQLGRSSDGEWGPFREWRHDLFWNDRADNHASVFDAIDRQRDGHDGPTREHFHHGEKSGSGAVSSGGLMARL